MDKSPGGAGVTDVVLSEPGTSWDDIRLRDPDVTACRNLWVAMLDEQRKLAFIAAPNSYARGVDIRAARAWFGTRDYYCVCALAGIDAEYLLAGFRRRLSTITGVAA